MPDCQIMVLDVTGRFHRAATAGDTLCWPNGTPMLAIDVPDTWAWDHLTGVPTSFPSDWGSITGIPATFAPSAHTHPMSEIIGLVSALAGKSDIGHTHTGIPVYARSVADITNTTTTAANVTGLSFTVAANTSYMGTVQFKYQCNGLLSGPALGFSGPTMSEALMATVHAPAAGGVGGIISNVGSLLTLSTTDQINTDRLLTAHFGFRVGGTGGTLQVQFARAGVAATVTARSGCVAQLCQSS